MTSLPSKSKAVAVCQCRNKLSHSGLCATTNDTRKKLKTDLFCPLSENIPVGDRMFSVARQKVFCQATERVTLSMWKVVPLYQGEGRHCTTKGKPPPFRDCEGWGLLPYNCILSAGSRGNIRRLSPRRKGRSHLPSHVPGWGVSRASVWF